MRRALRDSGMRSRGLKASGVCLGGLGPVLGVA